MLIVDDGYSSMETQIMLLQTYCEKLVIVGQETPGTNGNISRLSLPLNTSAQITGTNFEYANGKQFQKKGVIPDHLINIPFEVEMQGEVAKRTYVVNKAFEIAEQILVESE